MQTTSRLKGLLVLAAIAATSLLAACDNNSSQSATISSLPPQVVELGCPVQSDTEMQRIFSGVNGVDGMSRPLNNHGVPVDTNGNCLSTAPVPEVYAAPVSQAYVSVLATRYHYSYVWVPTYVHVYTAPGIIYRQNMAPTGRVIVQTTRPAGTTVTVPVGATQTVRPGPATTNTTVTPGAAKTVTPGAATGTNSGAAVGTTVTPAKAAAPTATFNRPTATPTAAPAAVTPARATAPTATFNRPTAPAATRSSSKR